ncbi:MAG: hypothetical protein KHY47_14320 [Prevotella sp.]|nr:hypothetical protein [Prevotella sp.]
MNKKFQLNNLFTSYAQFCNCAPGADTSADFDSLQGSAVAARKRIVAIIGNNTFSDIVNIEEEESGIKDFLRAAMANLTLATQIIFDAVNRRKNDINLYKYEMEGMKRSYMENYCVPLQKEVLDESIGAYFDRLEQGGEDQTFAEFVQKALPMLKRALVKKTVAKALRRFDILEFPATIRNLFDDNTATRSGSDEASRALQLATQLDGEVEDLLHNVDMLLDAQEGNDFLSFSAENRPDDNMYLMP